MQTISEQFFDASARRADRTAILCDGKALSYRSLARQAAALSRAMHSRGVNRRDHVAVVLPNSLEFVTIMIALADLGAVMVPLSTSLPNTAMKRAFVATDVKHVVATSSIMPGLGPDPFRDIALAGGIRVVVGGSCEGAVPFDELTGAEAAEPTPLFAAEPGDSYILTMTSGSTGDPKPIILSQQAKSSRAQAAIHLYGVTEDDITLAATPLYHSLAERLVLIPLLSGGTSVLMPRFSASEWVKTVSQHSVTFTIAVSSQLNQIAPLLNDPVFKEANKLRSVVSSSALLDLRVKEDLLAKLECEFHECYGASEVAIASSLDAAHTGQKFRSVGNAAPGVGIRILNEDGTDASPGQPGEILCSSPMMFSGYYKRPDLTRAAMRGEFFQTGDIGKLDEDGFLYFLGRKKEIIITGGINVYPADIEYAIEEYGQTAACAAFALADERLGEIVAVALVPRDTETFDLKGLRLHCAAQLADYQQPRKFFILDALPKNAMGKVMRHDLQTRFGQSA